MMYKEVVVQNPFNGQPTKAFEVPARETIDRWSEVTLEDGTKMRVKVTVIGGARLENVWDPEGNPVYVLKAAPMMDLIDVPGDLKKRMK